MHLWLSLVLAILSLVPAQFTKRLQRLGMVLMCIPSMHFAGMLVGNADDEVYLVETMQELESFNKELVNFETRHCRCKEIFP